MKAATSRWRWLGPVLVGLYAVWLSVGVFPIAPIEGDEQGVINGATARARGESAYLDLAYLPEIQPGSYALLTTASRWTGRPVETIFAVGTVAGAMLSVWLAAKLLAHLLELPRWVAVGALLWCQEISAAAYYMNTTAMGVWLTFLALWLACRPSDWRTCAGMALCLAVAGWIRIDCLLPAPAIAALIFRRTGNWRTAAWTTAATAAASLALVLMLYSASGVTWGKITHTFAERGGIEGWWPTVRSLPLILSPLLCVLLAAGLLLLLVRREGRMLAVVVAGAIATLPVYGTSLASTKYFYHLVPFMLVPALYAGALCLKKLGPASGRRKVAGAAAAVLLVTDQALALQTSSPEFRRFVPEPVLATLATLPGRDRPAKLVIGPGEAIPTSDGFRLRGGAFFAPLIWRREKTAMRNQLAQFSGILTRTPHATIYYGGWLPYQMVVRMLRGEDYAFKNRKRTGTMPYSGEWTLHDRTVQLDFLAYRTSRYFDPARQPANLTGENTYFVGDLSGVQPITELADAGEWRALWPDRLWSPVTFFRRVGPLPKP